MDCNSLNQKYKAIPDRHSIIPDGQQTGFYVVVSDRELLGKIHDLMKRQGYLGFMDTAGKLNYFVDGRQNMYKASHTISNLTPQTTRVLEEKRAFSQHLDSQTLKKLLMRILEQNGFNRQHKGTTVLLYLLPLALENEEQISPLSKYLYPLAARKFNMSVQQVDRIIRYAAGASQLKLGNNSLMHHLVDEMAEQIDAH